MKAIALDIGSRLTKKVELKNDTVVNTSIIDTVLFYKKIKRFIDKYKDSELYLTGYGKNNLNFGDDKLTVETTPELKAHFSGAMRQTGLKDFILLDIGGQDTKVILSKDGCMVDFRTNEKCAAASGRYIENMSSILGIEDLGEHFKDHVILSSTCAIFGESEVIGLLSNGIPVEKISAGVNHSLYLRVSKLISPLFSAGLPIIFCGGLYDNKAINHFLREEYKTKVIIPEFPIHNGAIGAYWSKRS